MMLLVIDGHSVAYRAYYKTPPLTNSNGVPTGVIHTFLNIIISLQEKLYPDEIIVVFDSKGKTERNDIDKNYKANRQPTPEDLIPQVDALKEILPYMKIRVLSQEGVEADDIIFSIVNKTEGKTFIITKDKDLYQLVGSNVHIYDYQKDEVIDEGKVVEKFGIKPGQIPDYLALVGDSSDNIPGVKGVGPKTAVPLLVKYGDLYGIYDNIDKLKPTLKDKLEKYKDDAYLSKQLATPIGCCVKMNYTPEFNGEKLKHILNKYELNKIRERVFGDIKQSELKTGKVDEPFIAVCIDNSFILADDKNFCFSTDYVMAEKACYVYSYKNICKFIYRRLEDVKDIEIMSWLNNPDDGAIKKQKNEKTESFLKRLINQADSVYQSFRKNEFEDVYYNIEIKVAEVLSEMEMVGIGVDSNILEKVNDELENMIEDTQEYIFSQINKKINLNSPKQLSEVLFDEMGIKPYKKTKTGYSTNEESLKNLVLLNPSYSGLLNEILNFREFSKLKNTYTSKLGEYINKETGRIHSTFNQVGTATGRLSSSNPNLQNIPQKGDIASKIRSSFVSVKGCSFISFDYSQIELRILAHLSGDETLLKAYENNEDIHTKTAALIFNVNEEDVDNKLRRIAKSVNFGIIYGLSPYGLARDTGVSQADAKKFIKKYFELYPMVDKYIKKTLTSARQKGYTETLFGRKRFVKDLTSKNKSLASRAERVAINAPIQGSAADIIKKAMVDTWHFLQKNSPEAKVVLQIHDELIFEVKDEVVDKLYKDLKHIMENVVNIDVKLKVNGSIGKNLGELK